MRFAVIADIHGILPALEAFLRELRSERVDGLIVAGDMVGGDLSRWKCCGNCVTSLAA